MSSPIVDFQEVELSRFYTEIAKGGPTFATSIIGNRYGVHQRNVGRTSPICKYTIDFSGQDLSADALEPLRTFFISQYGMGSGFRFFPPNDHAFRGDVIGTGNGSQTVFPLYRKYIGGAHTISRRICKPNNVAVSVYYNGVLQSFTLGTHYHIDTVNGTITFTSPPGSVSISLIGGEYDVPVVFDIDEMDISDDTTFADWNGVGLVELLPINLGIA